MSDAPIRLPRVSKGKRPQYFQDPAVDQMMTFIIELSAEVSVLYDRVDTIERLLDTKGTISRADIEAYRAPPNVETERSQRRDGYLKRVFRLHAPQDRTTPARATAAKPAPKKAKAKSPKRKKPKAKARKK